MRWLWLFGTLAACTAATHTPEIGDWTCTERSSPGALREFVAKSNVRFDGRNAIYDYKYSETYGHRQIRMTLSVNRTYVRQGRRVSSNVEAINITSIEVNGRDGLGTPHERWARGRFGAPLDAKVEFRGSDTFRLTTEKGYKIDCKRALP